MRRSVILGAVALAVAAAAAAAYWPALTGGLVWDDDGHITRVALRSLQGLRAIWLEPGATQQYYPVLHSLFWIEHRLWGDAPLGYHLANLLLHLAACVLLYRVLRRLEAPGALLAASLFALHPVCVESVAWISEQKNTLSTVFYMAAALAYLRFDERRRPGWYAIATALFAAALLSKSVAASLPAAILVAFWWKGRLSWRSAAPLAPWFCLSAAAAVVTPWVESKFVGAYGPAFDLRWIDRILIAGRAPWFYLGKIVWPADLVFIYPRWRLDAADAWQYVYALAAALALGALWALRGRARGPLAAALLFVGTLFPALGFINVYPFVFSFVADHFQYLAAAMMISALSAGASILSGRWLAGRGKAAGAAALCVGAALACLTWRQCGKYHDIETFYRSILERNPSSWLAHDNLGVVLVQRRHLEEAVGHYQEAIRLNPDYPQAYNNYGNVLAQEGRFAEAAEEYAGALRARPSFAAAEYNWGNAMNDAGRYWQAELHLRNALRIQPDYPQAHYALANALANSGRIGAAVPEYGEALRLEPDYPEAHANLGLALAQQGNWAEALAQITEAVRLRPGYAEAHAYLGFALAGSGRYEEALSAYGQALQIGLNNADLHYQMGLALRKLGRADEARAEFAEAKRMEARR
jgi:tetratricopeptide (TPR) repeat protein